MTRKPCATVACAALVALAIAGCQRPYERVSTSAPENLARNVSAAENRKAAEAQAMPPPRTAIPPAGAISDAMITSKVRAALLADDAMRGADVSINTQHGVVVLSGNVKSYEQVGIASAHAQKPDGVLRVDNQLTFVPS
jgi:hyperosmotically inducible protein